MKKRVADTWVPFCHGAWGTIIPCRLRRQWSHRSHGTKCQRHNSPLVDDGFSSHHSKTSSKRHDGARNALVHVQWSALKD